MVEGITSRRDHVGPVVIPAALQNITRCMVNTARAAPDVISAEWAVFSQNGEADIHVRYQYRIGDGGTGASDYSAQLDTIRETLNAPNTTRPIVRFWLIEPGVPRACDPLARSGTYHCPHNPGPGLYDEITTAWRKTCGVEVEYLSL